MYNSGCSAILVFLLFCVQMLHHFLRTIGNAAKLWNAKNFKPPLILKCHKFQNAVNVPLYFDSCPTFSLELLSYFHPGLKIYILKSQFFPTFSHTQAMCILRIFSANLVTFKLCTVSTYSSSVSITFVIV